MSDLRKLAAIARKVYDGEMWEKDMPFLAAAELEALADVVDAARQVATTKHVNTTLLDYERRRDAYGDLRAALDRLQETTR